MAKGEQKRFKPGQKPPVEDARKRPPSLVHSKIRVSFEYYDDGNPYCLSLYNAEQIRSFLACLRKLTERSWQQLVDGSSKDPAMKTGLNSTPYSKTDLKNPDIWPSRISPDVQLLGVRATQRRRVFGVRIVDVFYILWFDENHEVVKG